mmetsp:Transcript_13642/g.40542  ORF Transcript_13642/g.40542 Transcript_13642/m.40542 type:complete len:224 (-) Transcript_13642:183-854(-)
MTRPPGSPSRCSASWRTRSKRRRCRSTTCRRCRWTASRAPPMLAPCRCGSRRRRSSSWAFGTSCPRPSRRCSLACPGTRSAAPRAPRRRRIRSRRRPARRGTMTRPPPRTSPSPAAACSGGSRARTQVAKPTSAIARHVGADAFVHHAGTRCSAGPTCTRRPRPAEWRSRRQGHMARQASSRAMRSSEPWAVLHSRGSYRSFRCAWSQRVWRPRWRVAPRHPP